MAIRKSLLPSAYQQVEYIESSGTQYIDTGYYATTTSGINIDYAYTASGNAGLCGIFQSQAPRTDTLFISTLNGQTSSVIYLISRGGELTNNVVPTLGTKYNAKINYLNNRKLIINNTKTGNDGTNGVVSSRTIKLFCRDNNGNLAYTNARIYMCKITEGENIVRNFIPCYRKADNVAGLYDVVNGVFYTNQGTGTFAKGSDYVPQVKHIYKGSTRIIKKYKGSSLLFADVPSAYQQVQYLESTGSAYIDTGLTGDENTKIVADMMCVSGGGQSLGYFSANRSITLQFTNATAPSRFGTYSFVYTDWTAGERNVYEIDVSGYKKDGVYLYQNSTPQSFQTGNLYLFRCNGSSTTGSFRIYSYKIYSSGVLVQYLIPCYRKADDVIGMYDVVNDVFYTNAGSGEFTMGDDV